MKKGIGIVIVIVLALGAFVFTLFTYADSMVTRGVNYVMDSSLPSGGEVDKVHVGLLSGDLSISGLKIFNPPGFGSKELLSLELGETAVSLKELMKRRVHIKNLSVTGLTVRVERKGTKTNLDELIALARKKSGKGEATGEGKTAGKKVEVVIDRISIKKVRFFAPLIAEKKPVELENLTLTGPFTVSEKGGMTDVVNALVRQLQKEGAKKVKLPTSVQEVEKLKEKAKEGVKGIRKMFK